MTRWVQPELRRKTSTVPTAQELPWPAHTIFPPQWLLLRVEDSSDSSDILKEGAWCHATCVCRCNKTKPKNSSQNKLSLILWVTR